MSEEASGAAYHMGVECEMQQGKNCESEGLGKSESLHSLISHGQAVMLLRGMGAAGRSR